MKESDITPEVIKLSKEIAKLWKLEIYRGCWYHNSRDGKLHCWGGSFSIPSEELEFNLQEMLPKDKPEPLRITPIPSISDCVEKLRKLGWFIWQIWERGKEPKELSDWVIQITKAIESGEYVFGYRMKEHCKLIEASTLHKALLSALLEVLKK